MKHYDFLSDLCGREVLIDGDRARVNFLSDLCGREDDGGVWRGEFDFSKRPVRS
ncbi:hypothetical protein AO370_0378 [Moraxella catarrhalis]|uniref:Uncharacterized protein n=1 Tax=Moraxella catarrhalis TaxID=480 RepID=A0AB36DQL9_MORCA|nr:hypothetical protein AO370_0378 [Moraxella catarrhalis]